MREVNLTETDFRSELLDEDANNLKYETNELNSIGINQ